jgi:LCP family protein required for cell wall assembly
MLTLPLPIGQGSPTKLALTELWKSGFRYQVTRPVNILVMGVDEARDVAGAQPDDLVGRTDTMLLVQVDPTQESVNVLSIPRDTRVEIPGYGIDKINQANFEGGAELAAQTVRHNFNDVEIDRYVRISTGAFRELVDLVGGVEVFVPEPMHYQDQTQGLVIDLDPGWQTLNGDMAEQFARFRQDAYGDIGRVQRQQILLKALKERLINPTIIPQIPQMVRLLQRYIDTNLSPEEMLALAGFGLQLPPDRLHMVMLPGRFSDPQEFHASYWITNQDAINQVMQAFFQIEPIALLADTQAQRSISHLSIAIQNASGAPQVADRMADHLRQEGFHNVYRVRDWPDTLRQTQVIAQQGDLAGADTVQSILGFGSTVSDSTGDLESDITIRVGEDWLDWSQQ